MIPRGIGFLLGILVLLAGTPTAAAQVSTEDDGVGNLAACYAREGKMAVEFVVDQSGSLKQTDPFGARADLSRSVVQMLGALAAIPVNGQPGRIEVRVVGFGSQVDEVVGWQSLTPQTTDWVSLGLEQLRGRNSDQDTDYVEALIVARSDTLRRAMEIDGARPSSVCRAVFWFTDGKLDFEPTGGRRPWAPDLVIDSDEAVNEAIRRGTDELCRSGGVADSYRGGDSPTFLLTSALLSSSFSDASFLERVTTNSQNDCGAIPGRPVGRVFSGQDLFRLIPEIGPKVISNPPAPRTPGAAQPDGSKSVAFPVDPTTQQVVLLIDEQHDPALGPGKIVLVAPDGQEVDLSPAAVDSSVSGVPVTSRLSGPARVVSLNLSDSRPDATETWTVRAQPPAGQGRFDVWVSRKTGLGLQPVAAEPWVRGESGSVSFQLVDGSASPVPGTALSDVSAVTATVTHGSEPTPSAVAWDPQSGRFTATYKPSLDEPSSSATVSIGGEVVTASGDRVRLQQLVDVPVKVPGAPSVVGALNLGVLAADRADERDDDGRQVVRPLGPLDRNLTLEGAEGGNGRVCLVAAGGIRAGSSPVEITTAPAATDGCVDVPSGSQAELPLIISVGEPTDGSISGELRLETTSDLTDQTFVISVPVAGTMLVEPAEPITSSSVLIGLILGSLAAAAALWTLLSWRSASFNDVTLVQAFHVRGARLTPATAEFVLPGFDSDGWSYLEDRGSRRAAFVFDGGEIELCAPVRLFAPQDAVASRAGSIVEGSMGHRGAKGIVAHQLQGSWIFTVDEAQIDPEDPTIEGEIFFFIRRGAAVEFDDPRGLFQRAVAEISAHYDAIHERVQATGDRREADGETRTEPNADELLL